MDHEPPPGVVSMMSWDQHASRPPRPLDAVSVTRRAPSADRSSDTFPTRADRLPAAQARASYTTHAVLAVTADYRVGANQETPGDAPKCVAQTRSRAEPSPNPHFHAKSSTIAAGYLKTCVDFDLRAAPLPRLQPVVYPSPRPLRPNPAHARVCAVLQRYSSVWPNLIRVEPLSLYSDQAEASVAAKSRGSPHTPAHLSILSHPRAVCATFPPSLDPASRHDRRHGTPYLIPRQSPHQTFLDAADHTGSPISTRHPPLVTAMSPRHPVHGPASPPEIHPSAATVPQANRRAYRDTHEYHQSLHTHGCAAASRRVPRGSRLLSTTHPVSAIPSPSPQQYWRGSDECHVRASRMPRHRLLPPLDKCHTGSGAPRLQARPSLFRHAAIAPLQGPRVRPPARPVVPPLPSPSILPPPGDACPHRPPHDRPRARPVGAHSTPLARS